MTTNILSERNLTLIMMLIIEVRKLYYSWNKPEVRDSYLRNAISYLKSLEEDKAIDDLKANDIKTRIYRLRGTETWLQAYTVYMTVFFKVFGWLIKF